jgi:hypothetical protein
VFLSRLYGPLDSKEWNPNFDLKIKHGIYQMAYLKRREEGVTPQNVRAPWTRWSWMVSATCHRSTNKNLNLCVPDIIYFSLPLQRTGKFPIYNYNRREYMVKHVSCRRSDGSGWRRPLAGVNQSLVLYIWPRTFNIQTVSGSENYYDKMHAGVRTTNQPMYVQVIVYSATMIQNSKKCVRGT